MNDNDKKNEDDWENVTRSFMGDDVFDAYGLSRFFHSEGGKVIQTSQMSKKELRDKKIQEDWEKRSPFSKFVSYAVVTLVLGFILFEFVSCCLR